MKHFFQIITIVITLFGNSEYASEPYGHEEEVFWKRELTEPLQSKDMTSEEFESVARQNLYRF